MNLLHVNADEGIANLSRCFVDIPCDEVRRWHDEGRIAFYRAPNGYACVEANKHDLFVWAYEGRDVNAFAQHMRNIARARGIACVRFNTTHKGLHRLIARHRPRLIAQHGNTKTFEVPA